MKFYEDVKSKLGHRKEGFDYIFEYLQTIENPLIVETGCARSEDNYSGDGQSSLLFDKYIHNHGGEFFTVDISSESVEYSRSKMVSNNTHVILEDSITYLKYLNTVLLKENKKIDFLYLDSFDAPRDNPEVVFQSALHHLYEYTTILPSLKPNALIGVDDNWFEYRNGQSIFAGKGQFVADYMYKINNPICFNGYQLLWKNI